jgi:hypothetical protein
MINGLKILLLLKEEYFKIKLNYWSGKINKNSLIYEKTTLTT